MFSAKVEGTLQFARWLLALVPGAEAKYNEAYASWARTLLQAAPWRNAAVATAEMGWQIWGFFRAVMDVAARRARLWCLPMADLYGLTFRLAMISALGSWAARSRDLLLAYGVPDYCDFEGGRAPVAVYIAYIRGMLSEACAASWKRDVATHLVPFPYLEFFGGLCPVPKIILGCNVPWKVLQGHLAMARMRAGLLDLVHVNGKRSQARERQCIFCCRPTISPTLHVVSRCERFLQQRLVIANICGWGAQTSLREQAVAILAARPDKPLFHACALMCLEIQEGCDMFWA